MTELQAQIARFRRRLIVRMAAYAASLGLVAALVIVIAAPWLRDAIGAPGFWTTLSLPLLLPGIYVAWTWLRRPSERDVVLAADHWARAEGSIVSAWELSREHPDSPFVKPVAARAVAQLRAQHPPAPRLARQLVVTVAVLTVLVWVSRAIHAQLEETAREERRIEAENRVDVDPETARQLANDAGAVAEQAERAGADAQQELAEDLELAAREAQAGGGDRERALRDANSLADRARAQNETMEARRQAREALEENPASRELAEALESADPEALREAVRDLAADVHRADGSVDRETAEQLRRAVAEAREQAPNDAALRAAAEEIENRLSSAADGHSEQRRAEAAEEMREDGLSEEQIEQALDAMENLDRRVLEGALERLAESVDPLRDVEGDLMRRIRDAEISPEQARRLAEMARRLGERLELDAEALREMLRRGEDFEGLEEFARRAMEEGPPAGPDDVPDWARDAVPDDLRQSWREGGRGDSGADGEASGRVVEGEGRREGVDSQDTGDGERDPDKEEETLDPDDAGDETAARERTGREGTSDGVNTRDEEERLPRRYRDAARKYFERD